MISEGIAIVIKQKKKREEKKQIQNKLLKYCKACPRQHWSCYVGRLVSTSAISGQCDSIGKKVKIFRIELAYLKDLRLN